MSSAGFQSSLPDWGMAMWRASWQGGLAILIVWAICRLIPKIAPSIQCWLWRLAYTKLLVSLISLAPIGLPLLPPQSSPISESNISDPGFPLELSTGVGRVVASTLPSTNLPLLNGLFILWVAGMIWASWKLLREAKATRALRLGCSLADDPALSAECESLAIQMGIRQTPELLISPDAGTPLLIGIRKPAIVLPQSLWTGCDHAQRTWIVAHELTHLKRADLSWAWLARLARCVFFFHPLVWLAEHEWQQAQEIACDTYVLRLDQISPSEYGAVLLQVVQQQRGKYPTGLAAMRVADSYSTVKRRLNAMKHAGQLSHRGFVSMGILAAIAGVIALVPWRVVAAEATKLHQGLHSNGKADVGGLLSERMVQALQLSPDQIAKIRAANDAANTQINGILTHGQKEQLASLAATHRNAMEKLALNQEQRNRVEQLINQQEQAIHVLHGNKSLTPQQRDERLKALKLSHEADVKKLLTPEQLAKVKAVHEEAQKDLKAAPTEEQRQAVADLHNHLQAKAAEINNDPSLTQEQKDARLSELKKLAEAHMSQIMTDDQRKHRATHNLHGTQVKLSLTGLISLKTLTPDQKSRIETVYRELHTRVQETITPAQHAKLKELHSHP